MGNVSNDNEVVDVLSKLVEGVGVLGDFECGLLGLGLQILLFDQVDGLGLAPELDEDDGEREGDESERGSVEPRER